MFLEVQGEKLFWGVFIMFRLGRPIPPVPLNEKFAEHVDINVLQNTTTFREKIEEKSHDNLKCSQKFQKKLTGLLSKILTF